MSSTLYLSVTTPASVAAIAPDLVAALKREAGHSTVGDLSNVTSADVTTTTVANAASAALNLKTDETVQLKVDATGGTYTLTFGGQTTSAIAYDAAASAVQSALVALSTIAAGEVSVSGGPGDNGGTTPYYVQFTAGLGGTDVGAITGSDASLTGGGAATTKTVVIAGGTTPT